MAIAPNAQLNQPQEFQWQTSPIRARWAASYVKIIGTGSLTAFGLQSQQGMVMMMMIRDTTKRREHILWNRKWGARIARPALGTLGDKMEEGGSKKETKKPRAGIEPGSTDGRPGRLPLDRRHMYTALGASNINPKAASR